MSKKLLFKEFVLLLVTIIWGFGFIFQSIGGGYLDPYSLNFTRNLFASIFLAVLLLISILYKKKKKTYKKIENKGLLILGGILIGLSLGGAMIFQQIGINLEGAGKSGFLTALYIIFVPIISIFFTKKISPYVLIAIVFAVTGLYLINFDGQGFSFSLGSVFLLLCALMYSIQILLIDYFSKKFDSIPLSLVEFIIAAVMMLPFMFTLGNFNWESFVLALPSALFLGLCSTGLGYTMQMYAQKDVNVTLASIIMSLESVFALLFGMLVLQEEHTWIQLLGCLGIFVGVIVAQIPTKIYNNDIKIVFTDLDWTLFDHNIEDYPKSTIKALRKLRRRGVKVIINTARCYSSMLTVKAFEKIPHDGYICSNGGIAYVEGKYLYREHIEPKLVNEIIDFANKEGYLLQIISPTYSKLINEENELSKTYYKEWLEYHPKVEPYEGEEVTSIVLFCKKDEEDKFLHFPIKAFRFYKYCVDLTPKIYSKADGVKAVLKYYGIDKEHAMAIGDGESDIDMFDNVKYSVAMGNANPYVKSHAGMSTARIDEKGFKKALKKLKLI